MRLAQTDNAAMVVAATEGAAYRSVDVLMLGCIVWITRGFILMTRKFRSWNVPRFRALDRSTGPVLVTALPWGILTFVACFGEHSDASKWWSWLTGISGSARITRKRVTPMRVFWALRVAYLWGSYSRHVVNGEWTLKLLGSTANSFGILSLLNLSLFLIPGFETHAASWQSVCPSSTPSQPIASRAPWWATQHCSTVHCGV